MRIMMRLLLLIALAVLSVQVAMADVRVKCVIESETLLARYRETPQDATAATAADAIARAVAQKLRDYMPQWRYVTAGIADATLELHVKTNLAKKHTFVLMLKNGSGTVKSWPVAWCEQVDIDNAGGLPPLDKLGSKVVEGLADNLLDDEKMNLVRDAMKEKVPVASGGQWLRTVGRAEDVRIVLPLPWTDSQVLNRSTFRVECSWPPQDGHDGEIAQLDSRAMTKSATYKDGTSQQRYEALTVQPVTITRPSDSRPKPVRGLIQEVQRLIPIRAYLVVFQDPIGLAAAGSGGGQ
jgi:hypothetical protein